MAGVTRAVIPAAVSALILRGITGKTMTSTVTDAASSVVRQTHCCELLRNTPNTLEERSRGERQRRERERTDKRTQGREERESLPGWTKLFSSIVTSSVWCEDDKTLRVWIALLALSDQEGLVEGSLPGMASLCRLSVEETKAVLEKLTAPDPYSRSPEFEGRRIEAVEGGWKVLNYEKYRQKGMAGEGSRAPYYRAYRARKRAELFKDESEDDR